MLRESKDTYQAEVILPNLLRLMALKKGDRVLDLACGQGFFSAAFLRDGADVIGADISKELIALAKKNVPGAKFFVAAAHKVEAVKDAGADRIALVLAAQNIDNIKDVFAECRRMLAPGGKLHIVMNHPAFRVPKGSGWAWDKNGSQYRRVDKYLTESKVKIQMHPGDAPEEATVSFHRPLQFYVKALAKTGFCVANLEEWISHKTSDSGPRAAEENRARKEIPMFLYLEATRGAA